MKMSVYNLSLNIWYGENTDLGNYVMDVIRKEEEEQA